MLIQPIDTLKVQVQVVSEQKGKLVPRKATFIIDVLKQIYNEKGLKILYRGLGSAIWRQIYYASARLGSYTWAVEHLKNKGVKIGLPEKIGISAFSGIFGAIIGNPFDVALIRRQASVTTGANAYNSTFHAFKSIVYQ
jgi:solute carrier family 25 oxoglutarate transporter 11